MTDTSSFPATHPATLQYPVTTTTSLASPLANRSPSDNNLQEEEEYTIKCICIYTDDDGNTVLCEKCDTWQHIDCYYHNQQVPDIHFCADCFPRDLDAKSATERQRRVREQVDGGDRRVKRSSSKSTKKKQKENNVVSEQINGWHVPARPDPIANLRDQPPPAKKPKTSHRASGSVASVNGETRKRASSNLHSYPSPSRSPQDLYRYPPIPLYTNDFLELYERDEGNVDVPENQHTVKSVNELSKWREDPSKIVLQGQQPNANSPFVNLSSPPDQTRMPEVVVEVVQNTDVDYDGRVPTWRLLRTKEAIRKDQLVGEIRGEVGHLEEYCHQQQSPNRYTELSHPDPFVFFHPHMDIYIDSRKGGTQFRYLRRSCRPNLTLKTFIVKDEELPHHCFVASKDISACAELTVQWFIDPKMFNLEDIESPYRRYDWASRVLANFGDCACGPNSAQPCLLAPFDRRQPMKAIEAPAKQKRPRKQKPKVKATISPSSTGQATNSRAGSEAVKGQDDDEQFDRRSTSGSSQSGLQSRDITPINVASLDADPILGNGLTAREMRKIQAVERAFREQGTQDKHKKKKRTSGGSTLNTPNINASKQLGHGMPYSVTPGVSHQNQIASSMTPTRSGSPSAGRTSLRHSVYHMESSFAHPVRVEYKSISVQTEPDEGEIDLPLPRRRKFLTPTQRLLRRVLQDRTRHERECKNTPHESSESNYTPGSLKAISPEVEMKDTAADNDLPSSPPASDMSTSEATITNAPFDSIASHHYPLPSQAAHSQTHFKPPPVPRLHLSTMPTMPVFPSVASSATPGSTMGTPAEATSSVSQSPFSFGTGSGSYPGLTMNMVTPSPAKKKLSLGDYMSRRNMATTPAAEKTQAQAYASASEIEDAKNKDLVPESASSPIDPSEQISPTSFSDHPISGGTTAGDGVRSPEGATTPMRDDLDEPEYSPPDASPAADLGPVQPNTAPWLVVASTANPSSMTPEVRDVLDRLAQIRRANDKGLVESTGSS